VQDEARDVVAEREPGKVIESRVLAGEDPAQTCLLGDSTEASERARHAGQCRRSDENDWWSP